MPTQASLRALLLLAALLPAACGPVQPFVPDTARMAPGALGGFADPDVTAVNLAQWAFSDSGRTYGRPIEGARAMASMDYIAGQLYTSPRWSNVSALTKQELLQARVETRQVLGILPGVSSQAVVDSLTQAGNALAAGDQAAAVAAVSRPIYAQPGEPVLQRLANLPYMRIANIATQHAAGELIDSSSSDLRL